MAANNSDAPISIKVLGGLDIRAGGQKLAFPTRHAMVMFAYLAIENKVPQTRSRLIGLFWGDRGEAQARGSLRQTIYRIRSVLSPIAPDAVSADARAVSLDPGLYRTDLDGLFAAGQDSGDVPRGEFLEGWEGLSPDLDEWIRSHRERIRDRLRDMLRSEIGVLEGRSDYAGMAAAARRLAAMDRFDEEALRWLMTGLALAGNPAGAREAYEQCARMLSREIRVEPMEETQALARAIAEKKGRFAGRALSGGERAISQPMPGSMEKRHVSVLALWAVHDAADGTDPERVMATVQRLHGPLAGIMERFGGSLIRPPHLVNLCWFGWPLAAEDAAECAMRAAMALNAQISCRIGISSGEVIAGEGQEPVGQPPDEAMRLMAAAAPGEIRVAPQTGALAEVGFLFGRLDKEGHLLLQGERVMESRFAARNLDSANRMIGRERELELLMDRVGIARDGEGQLILVTGEAGIGKSILAEAGGQLARDMNGRCILLQCSRFAQNMAFGPVVEHLRMAAGLPDIAAPALRRRQLTRHLRANGVESEAQLAVVCGLLGLSREGGAATSQASSQEQRAELLSTLTDYFLAQAGHAFTYIVLEDAHWSDPSTLELVNMIVAAHADRPVAVVITARPEFDPSAIADHGLTGLALSGLARSDLAKLVRLTAEDQWMPDALVGDIVARADGIPLFAEELTRSYLRAGADAWSASNPPAALREALAARLDVLGPTKAVAQRAACVGRRFAPAPLRAACGDMADQVDSALLRMLEEKLIFRHVQPGGESYIFRHALVRDAAYDSLPRSERKRVHDLLYLHFRDSRDAPSQLVAWHAAAAERHETALDLYVSSGNAALAQFAHREARGHFEQALQLIGHVAFTPAAEEKRLEILSQLSLCHAHAEGYGHPHALSILEEAQRMALSLPASKHAIPILWQTYSLRFTHADHDEVRKVGEQMLSLEHWNLEYGAQEAVGLRFVAAGDMLAGRFAEAERGFARAGEILAREDVPSTVGSIGVDQRIPTHMMRARVLACMGREAAARAIVERMYGELAGSDHLQSRIMLAMMASQVMLVLRDFAAAGEFSAQSLELSRRRGASMWEAYSDCIVALTRLRQGYDPTAADAFRGAREQLAASHTRVSTTLLDALFGEALAEAGAPDAAVPAFARAASAVDENVEPWCHAEVMRLDAACGEATGRHDRKGAVALCGQAMALAQAQGAGLWIENLRRTLKTLEATAA